MSAWWLLLIPAIPVLLAFAYMMGVAWISRKYGGQDEGEY